MAPRCLIIAVFCFIFAGCAAKNSPIAIQKNKYFGDETLQLVTNGHYSLGCDDARYMAYVFSQDNFTVTDLTIRMTMAVTNKNKLSKNDRKKINLYIKMIDSLTKKFEKKYKNDPKAMSVIMKKIFNKDINGVISAAIATFAGLSTMNNYNEFVNINFCGAKPSAHYRSPMDVTSEELRNALFQIYRIPGYTNR